MADYLGLIDKKYWLEISNDFDYVTATENFVGLKLFPLFKTDNMKVAIAQLTKEGKIPTIALVHALDAETRIGERNNLQEFSYELLLIKEKLNQGEALRKLLGSGARDAAMQKQLDIIFDDINNLIMRVLTRFEVMACQALCKGKIFINENGVKTSVDFGIASDHKVTLSDWSDPSKSIIQDIVTVQEKSDDTIQRMLVSPKVMQYMLLNTELKGLAANKIPSEFLTRNVVKQYFADYFDIEIIVVKGKYKTSALATSGYNFFDEDKVVFLTTKLEVGKTFVTSTPSEDYGMADMTTGYVAVKQWYQDDPEGIWTKAEAIGLPCFADTDVIYIGTIPSE